MSGIRRSAESQVILTFNASHKNLKEAIKRAAELDQALTPPQLAGHQARARSCSPSDGRSSPRSRTSPTATASTPRSSRTSSSGRRSSGTCRARPAHECARAGVRGAPSAAAVDSGARRTTERPLRLSRERLAGSSWTPSSRSRCRARSASRSDADGADSIPIPLLREQIEACPQLLSKASEEMLRMLDGNRVEPLESPSYFAGGIETEEQLDAALDGLRERVPGLIAAGKKVFIQ